MILLAAIVCTAVYSGVCVIPEGGGTPQCPRTRPRLFAAESRDSLDAAVRELAKAVRDADGNTLKLDKRADEKRGGVYHVEGWGYQCAGESRE